ncbi:MAG TPA: glycosyltransferase family 4 protein [Nitrospinota bacterium]|nr:glycosyltransferase family 4 protein [Nitrospinota bacterium]|tara:strand:+ start:276 stop:1385 length:1110 start_codon:yes stop_codon:yes gene_type:complete
MWTIFHTEASLGWGGQEIRILNESICMRERGHRIIIITPAESSLMKKASDRGFEVISASFKRKDYPATCFKILKLIRLKRPDFINTHSSKDSWVASFAARLSNDKPFIIRTRHLSTPVAINIFGSVIYKLLPHKIITTGEAIREQLIERNRVSPGKIMSIPTGVDLKLFDPSKSKKKIRKELSLTEKTPIVGMVSVLRSWKGHNFFIEAIVTVLKKFSNVRFLIVGDGPRKESLTKMIKEKGLSETILMLGHREDVPEIMASLDILVHPSYANEGVPQSIVQGMAMGVPVIASDIKPLKEVVTDGETGLLSPNKDSGELAKRIILLLKNKELMRKMGNNGQKFVVEKFSMEKMIISIENLYKNMAGKLQ